MRRLRGFAVGGMATATLVSRGLGFARSVALVWLIGGTAASVGGQAFNVANELPINVANLIVGSAIGSFLIPQIVAAVRCGHRDRAVVDGVITVAPLGAAAITAALTSVGAFFSGRSLVGSNCRRMRCRNGSSVTWAV